MKPPKELNAIVDRKIHLRVGPNITACGMILSSDPSIHYSLNPTCQRCQRRGHPKGDLDQIVDKVLAYTPKPKSKAAKKRKRRAAKHV